MCVCVCMYIKRNKSANDFKCGTLSFYFIQLCSTRNLDSIVLFR